jgi:hypothetical protein
LRTFLKKTGIDLELSQALNVRLLDNAIIYGRIQSLLVERQALGGDVRDLSPASPSTARRFTGPDRSVFEEECLRYMRYATAAYGDSMIRAAELDVTGSIRLDYSSLLAPVAKALISRHVGVPEDDLVVLDVDYDGDVDNLRHIVAVDHAHKKVVLSVRGTYSVGELVVDAAGYSRHFCGGEAHSGMADMAERVWKEVGPTVLTLLKQNKEYELILTGHSLGAGTACLLNIMCHQRGRSLVAGRGVQCFAFAPPPVFTPIEFASSAADHCISVIHERDVVPFLSVDSVRHFFRGIEAVENHLKGTGFRKRMSYLTGYSTIEDSLVEAVQSATKERLPPKQGAPILAIPASTNLWLRRVQDDGGDDRYDIKLCDPMKLSTLGIRMDPNMLQDHIPPRYEHALHNLQVSDEDSE